MWCHDPVNTTMSGHLLPSLWSGHIISERQINTLLVSLISLIRVALSQRVSSPTHPSQMNYRSGSEWNMTLQNIQQYNQQPIHVHLFISWKYTAGPRQFKHRRWEEAIITRRMDEPERSNVCSLCVPWGWPNMLLMTRAATHLTLPTQTMAGLGVMITNPGKMSLQ